ncbi:MAG: hypothetical protein IPO87_08165 [Flavobacteriales bacterium]|nr:hypothetical protein [Flavobacteriales bacterium]
MFGYRSAAMPSIHFGNVFPWHRITIFAAVIKSDRNIATGSQPCYGAYSSLKEGRCVRERMFDRIAVRTV